MISLNNAIHRLERLQDKLDEAGEGWETDLDDVSKVLYLLVTIQKLVDRL